MCNKSNIEIENSGNEYFEERGILNTISHFDFMNAIAFNFFRDVKPVKAESFPILI